MQVTSKKVYWKKQHNVPNTSTILPLQKIFYQNLIDAFFKYFSRGVNALTNTRASLPSSSLNSLLRVKVTGSTLQEYHDEHVVVVEFW